MSADAAARWERIQSLFLDALEQPAPARAAWLARAAGNDPNLVAEATSLLAAHEEGGPIGDPQERISLQRVGDWRLLRLLGEGGMGTVYLAERALHDFTQTAALKLIRAGYVDRLLDERLRSERRILARLEHPGIARFVDGGATPTGQPWVAMEYVEGVPIDAWCRTRRVGLRERVRLFLGVCDAMQYAHQQLVVHRDLKPGNILVTETGRAKVLDFGIAKAIGEEAVDITGEHGTSSWITPAYASPEQVRGEPATTPTDIYALGVVLYELLTEWRPYQFDSLAPAAVQRVVCDAQPPRPSDAVKEGAPFGVSLARVRRTLQGDLDLIALKALAKEPERRYASVQQLGDDLRRWLDDEPVQARPDSMGYRLRKFAQRHRNGVIAAGIGAAALLAGIITTGWQAAVAKRERDRANAALLDARTALGRSEDVTEFLMQLFEDSRPELALSDTLAARALLRHGEARAEALAGQPIVQAALLDALGRVYERLAQYGKSRAFLERAVALRREHLGPGHPDVASSLNHLAVTRRRVGEYWLADSLHREALAILRARPNADPFAIATTLEFIGYVEVALARLPVAESAYREAQAIRRANGPADDSVAIASLRALASTVGRSGRIAESDSIFAEVLALATRRYGADHPLTTSYQVFLADRIADSLPVVAESLYRRAIRLQRAQLRPDDLAPVHALGSLSDLLVKAGRLDEAMDVQMQLLWLQQNILGVNHPNYAWTLDGIAGIRVKQRRFREADSLYRQSLAIQTAAFEPRHAALASTMENIADLEEARGNLPRAEALEREVLEIRNRALVADHPLTARTLARLAHFQRRRGDRAAAIANYRHALDIERRYRRQEHAVIQALEAVIDTLQRQSATRSASR